MLIGALELNETEYQLIESSDPQIWHQELPNQKEAILKLDEQ